MADVEYVRKPFKGKDETLFTAPGKVLREQAQSDDQKVARAAKRELARRKANRVAKNAALKAQAE